MHLYGRGCGHKKKARWCLKRIRITDERGSACMERWKNNYAKNVLIPQFTVGVVQLALSLVFNQVFSISRSWSLGFWNCVLILSSVPVFTLSWSPRGYHCADTSRTSSNTQPRSSEVSLFPGMYEKMSLYIHCSVATLIQHNPASKQIWELGIWYWLKQYAYQQALG